MDRLAIFPVRNADVVQNESQFSHTPLQRFTQILDDSFEEHFRSLQILFSLGG
jgi:hypothetical protein